MTHTTNMTMKNSINVMKDENTAKTNGSFRSVNKLDTVGRYHLNCSQQHSNCSGT